RLQCLAMAIAQANCSHYSILLITLRRVQACTNTKSNLMLRPEMSTQSRRTPAAADGLGTRVQPDGCTERPWKIFSDLSCVEINCKLIRVSHAFGASLRSPIDTG